VLHRSLTSPKRSGARRNSDLYYYYAAFAQSFVEQKVIELNLNRGSIVLDPWCGSGTTLVAARRLGHNTIGCDINPVSVVLSKSRFASPEDAAIVLGILEGAVGSILSAKRSERRPEILLWTLRDKLFGYGGAYSWSAEQLQSIEPRIALLLTALFFIARQAVQVSRSKNPGWRKLGTTPRLNIRQLKVCLAKHKKCLDETLIKSVWRPF
jgi:hypothetical protein